MGVCMVCGGRRGGLRSARSGALRCVSVALVTRVTLTCLSRHRNHIARTCACYRYTSLLTNLFILEMVIKIIGLGFEGACVV